MLIKKEISRSAYRRFYASGIDRKHQPLFVVHVSKQLLLELVESFGGVGEVRS